MAARAAPGVGREIVPGWSPLPRAVHEDAGPLGPAQSGEFILIIFNKLEAHRHQLE